MSYKILETKRFIEKLRSLDPVTGNVLYKKLLNYVYPQLSTEPHFGLNIKKLKNWHPMTWRYRVGPWRFFYEIDDSEKIITMVAVHQRKDAY